MLLFSVSMNDIYEKGKDSSFPSFYILLFYFRTINRNLRLGQDYIQCAIKNRVPYDE